MRQYAGFGTAAESNRRYKFLLASGQTGLSVAFDLPTQMGRDADHPLARGRGRARRRLDLVHRRHARAPRRVAARQRLDVDDHQRHRGDAALPLRRRRRRARHRRDAARRARSRTTSSRSTSRAARTSTRRRPSMRLVRRHLRLVRATSCPRWNTHHHQRLPHPRGGQRRRAGGRLHAGRRHRLRRGGARPPACAVDDFAPRLSFFFNAHANLLEEVAKFRAARRLWARIMRDRFGAAGSALADAALSRPDGRARR